MLQNCRRQVLHRKKPETIRLKIEYEKYLFSRKERLIYGIQSIGITRLPI